MEIHSTIVPRPLDVPVHSGPVVTPHDLVEQVLQTAASGLAVRFTTDVSHLRRLRPRVLTLCRQRGLTLHYVAERPHARQHRTRTAAHTVVMWCDAE
jgi:hypothetical protein